MTEVLKLMASLFLVYCEHDDFKSWRQALCHRVTVIKMDTIKVLVPSLVYVIQNNLLYISASHLDATTYQITYQLRILTTSLFSVLMLKRKLLPSQWAALVLLVLGVAIAQLSSCSEAPKQSNMSHAQNRFIGFSAVLVASFLSGFAGIVVEMILKCSDISIWMRNVQLTFLSFPLALLMCLISDWNKVVRLGWFYGYDYFIAYLIVLQAAGGMLSFLVVKHSDNILKGFATSLAIVISGLASVFLFNFRMTVLLITGAMMVIGSILLYSKPAKVEKGPVRFREIENI
ncbi:UDP-N-acetylglucosamine transporter isoform X2 [Halyomorpha halys]|nr:UDP-N-acetylglucosamine transporter-like isoform X2 [Halyomorpha halys]